MGDVTEYARVRGKGNGSKLRGDGRLVVCDYLANCILEVDIAGQVTLVTDSDVEGKPLSRGPNDVVVAKNGDLYFTAPQGSGRNNPVGKVYHYSESTQRTTIVADGMAFPNGLSLSNGEDALYIAESQHSRIWLFPVLSPGKLGTGEVFVTLPGGHEPDGIDFDDDGNLYIAYYGSRIDCCRECCRRDRCRASGRRHEAHEPVVSVGQTAIGCMLPRLKLIACTCFTWAIAVCVSP